MADAHLGENHAVGRALHAVIVLPAAEAIPHVFHLRRDRRGGPVGIAVVGDHGAQMLEGLVLIFHRGLQPVVRVQIHHDPALVKAVVAPGEIGLYHKGEKLLLRLHLKNWRVIVAEMVVGPLPEIRVRLGRDRDPLRLNVKLSRFSRPYQAVDIHRFLPSAPKRYIMIHHRIVTQNRSSVLSR